jgi:uncharacterized protein YaiI (UPF0178 family)
MIQSLEVTMQIWVDADACPRAVKEIIYRTAIRRELLATLVANQPMTVPRSDFIQTVLVKAGLDEADAEIVRLLSPADLVITADIPLAAAVVEKGGFCLSPRGEEFLPENIGERLAVRDFMTELRDSGTETGGPPPFSPGDKKRFADALDRFLARHYR